MHLLGFVISPLIENDKSENICFKIIKIEQLGEKIHTIWNLLHRIRFFAIRNGCQKLLHMFTENDNSLYVREAAKNIPRGRVPRFARLSAASGSPPTLGCDGLHPPQIWVRRTLPPPVLGVTDYTPPTSKSVYAFRDVFTFHINRK